MVYTGNNGNAIFAARKGPWKLHIGLYSQTGNNYGFTASPRHAAALQRRTGSRTNASTAAREEPACGCRTAIGHFPFNTSVNTEQTFWGAALNSDSNHLMKNALLSILLISRLAHATPPVLSLTQAALQKVDPDIKPDHYDIARTDLNADGKEDVLALMNGKSGYRGSGGATMFILKGTAEGFESLGSIKVVNEPIYARKSVHHGFRDLLVTVRGGGAKPGLSALQFDGKAYPASPGEATAKAGGNRRAALRRTDPTLRPKGNPARHHLPGFQP